MKNINEITPAQIESVIQKKGYKLFTEQGQVNIVGIRSPVQEVNEYADVCWVWYADTLNGIPALVSKSYEITTHPGKYYLQNPIPGTNGTAILVPGQYIGCWVLGMHLGKQFALCQRGAMVKVYRDSNKDTVLDCNPATIQEGWFGIDGHHGSVYDTDVIDKWSAGCQVWRFHQQHEDLMKDLDGLSKKYGYTRFTYTLLELKDFE